MKNLSVEALASLRGERPIVAGAGKFVFGTGTYRWWSGTGTLTIEDEPYIGIEARALLMPIASQRGGAADSIQIEVSNLDPDVAQSIEFEDYHQRPVTIRRLFFAPDRQTMIGSAVYMRGRVDTVQIIERIGGESTLRFLIEGPRRDMNRAGSRIRSDADQRVLGGATDGSLKHIGMAGHKTLVWGQKPQQGLAGRSAERRDRVDTVFV